MLPPHGSATSLHQCPERSLDSGLYNNHKKESLMTKSRQSEVHMNMCTSDSAYHTRLYTVLSWWCQPLILPCCRTGHSHCPRDLWQCVCPTPDPLHWLTFDDFCIPLSPLYFSILIQLTWQLERFSVLLKIIFKGPSPTGRVPRASWTVFLVLDPCILIRSLTHSFTHPTVTMCALCAGLVWSALLSGWLLCEGSDIAGLKCSKAGCSFTKGGSANGFCQASVYKVPEKAACSTVGPDLRDGSHCGWRTMISRPTLSNGSPGKVLLIVVFFPFIFIGVRFANIYHPVVIPSGAPLSACHPVTPSSHPPPLPLPLVHFPELRVSHVLSPSDFSHSFSLLSPLFPFTIFYFPQMNETI